MIKFNIHPRITTQYHKEVIMPKRHDISKLETLVVGRSGALG